MSCLIAVSKHSKVEHHGILRAILRLQIYQQIRLLCGPSRKLKRRIRALFSQWTSWEFAEVRSVAEWTLLEHKKLPRHYADGIQTILKSVARHFEKDLRPYVKSWPAPRCDRNRRAKFAKRPKKWKDTPAAAHEGSAGRRNKDWNPVGYHYGCFKEYAQTVYQQFCLAEGYPFWSRYTDRHGWGEPLYSWWHRRHDHHDLMLRFE